MFDNVIFDFDGTLFDTAGDIRAAFKKACASCGCKIALKLHDIPIGPPLTEIISIVAPGADIKQRDKIIKEFKRIYDSSSYPHTKPYTGVPELLEILRDSKKKIFVATNKRSLPTKKIIRNHGYKYFRDIVTIDSLREAKYSKAQMIKHLIDKWGMKKNKTLMVGDAESDIIAARTNKILSCVVLYGYGDKRFLRGVDSDYMISSPKQLIKIILKGD
ncbi:MAG: HAD family hydrolase [Candidatus Omnitrophota bacterium]